MNPVREPIKTLVIYDSLYGNTEKVAKVIASAVGGEAKPAGNVDPSELNSLDLLIVGSPTHGGRPSPKTQEFLNKIPNNSLNNFKFVAFDTRFEKREHGVGLQLVMGVFGFAAGRIAKALESKGGKLVAEPEGFIVEGKEGPLKEGELDRAATWAKGILESAQ
jgi:flavodoxin